MFYFMGVVAYAVPIYLVKYRSYLKKYGVYRKIYGVLSKLD